MQYRIFTVLAAILLVGIFAVGGGLQSASANDYCVGDGRLNDDFCGYPVAIFWVDGSLHIYSVDTVSGGLSAGRGDLTLDLSQLDLPACAVNPYTGQPVCAYELDTWSGEIQINTAYADGKEYIFVVGNRGGELQLGFGPLGRAPGGYHLAR